MAKILKTEDQNNALATINKNLKSVASINSILSSKDDTGELIYIVAGDKLKLPVPVTQITPLLTGIRKAMADEVKQQMIDIASAMAGKVVAASIDTKIQDSLVEETLKEVGDKTWQS